MLFIAPLLVQAQTAISLDAAYEKALQNNLDIKSGQLGISYQAAVQQSYHVIDPLSITTEIGQMNSSYVDSKIAASQTLRMPKYYKAQQNVMKEELKNAGLMLVIQKWQLKREIALVFNTMNYLDEKEKLLRKTQDLYNGYYKKAELRLKMGESNILEKTTAEHYRSQASLQLNSIRKEKEIAQYQLAALINDGIQYNNEPADFYHLNIIENADFKGNPLLIRRLQHQRNIEDARLEAEKAKLLPTFSVGISSMTMKGNGADNQYYNGTHRFQSGMVGVALPLFNTAQKSVIEGQKINQQIADNNLQIAVVNAKNQFAKMYGEYQKLKAEAEYYRTDGLRNAEKILFTANLLMKEGEINYLEYTTLVNQAFDIQNKYVDAQKLLNEKIIEINQLQQEN